MEIAEAIGYILAVVVDIYWSYIRDTAKHI